MTDNHEQHLTILRNDSVIVGVLPEAGGRVVLLRRPGGENILKAVPEKWDTATHPVPQIGPAEATQENFVHYYGHVVWVGPQTAWWQHQNLNGKLKKDLSEWPPDPCLAFSNYEINKRSETHIVMEGPASEVTGLQMVKSISLLDDGGVRFKATATNRRDEPVAWDLWTNTRLEGTRRAYVPVGGDEYCRYEFSDTDIANRQALPFRVVDGFYTLTPEKRLLQKGVAAIGAKAFLPCKAGWMAAFTETDLFIKKSAPVPVEDIHPQQSFAEIYQRLDTTWADTVLELEMHGKFRRLVPEESMSFEETWRLLPYDGDDTPEAHANFLRKTIG